MPWNPSLLDIFQEYFGTNYVLVGIIVAVAAIGASFSVFLISRNHSVKNTSLFSTMAISSSLSMFIFASLAFCVTFFPLYRDGTDGVIFMVLRLSLLPTLSLGPIAFYFLRKRALAEIYPFFSSSTNSQ